MSIPSTPRLFQCSISICIPHPSGFTFLLPSNFVCPPLLCSCGPFTLCIPPLPPIPFPSFIHSFMQSGFLYSPLVLSIRPQFPSPCCLAERNLILPCPHLYKFSCTVHFLASHACQGYQPIHSCSLQVLFFSHGNHSVFFFLLPSSIIPLPSYICCHQFLVIITCSFIAFLIQYTFRISTSLSVSPRSSHFFPRAFQPFVRSTHFHFPPSMLSTSLFKVHNFSHPSTLSRSLLPALPSTSSLPTLFCP